MAENWLDDVRKYDANADEGVVDKIVKYLGIALRNRDSSLVSFSDKSETDRVRENYLKKKLGLTDSDATLDAAIANVGERMKEDRTKNRVTVYYLLAEHFGLLSVFGGAAKAAGAGLAGAAAAGAAAVGATAAAAATPVPAATPPAPPVEPVRVVEEPVAAPQTAYESYDDDSGGGMGWLKWLLLAALLAAALFFLLKMCNKQEAVAPVDGDNVTITANDTDVTGNGTDATTNATVAIPEGSGVTTEEVAGKPKLTVYFDTGKSEVHKDLSTAAAGVKNYADANAGSWVQVSGFNDPTGNAAANAELSKNRAQAVKAALEKTGIAADRVVLVKPAETTGTGGNNAESRRVEVTVNDASVAKPVE